MMNETVARIVEIMFQNTEMNDEVQAIKDEVMNNCQERYQDLVNRGVDEDQAIAAVVESLKGMEEVIAQYPRKHEELEDLDDMDDDMDDTEVDKVFAAYLVKQVMVTLPSDDVNVETSMDENVHVYYDKEDFKNIRVQLNNGVLAIDRMNEVEKPESPRVKVEISQKDDEEEESGWQNLSDMISSIGKKLNKLRVNIQINNQGGGEITIAVPENHPVELDIHTASGDVDIDGVNATTIAAGTTSGDVTVQLPGDVKPQEIKVKGTSGCAGGCSQPGRPDGERRRGVQRRLSQHQSPHGERRCRAERRDAGRGLENRQRRCEHACTGLRAAQCELQYHQR